MSTQFILNNNYHAPFRPCFFGWLKQFNHSHPPSTNFNQLQPLLSTTKFHCIPFSTRFNLLQPTPPIYHPLFTTERNRPLKVQIMQFQLISKTRTNIILHFLMEHMNKLGNGTKFYTFNNGDWGKVKEDKGSRDVGRWWKAATGGIRWRQ